jgi:hypothetical protein
MNTAVICSAGGRNCIDSRAQPDHFAFQSRDDWQVVVIVIGVDSPQQEDEVG